jgi:hypothetical protein
VDAIATVAARRRSLPTRRHVEVEGAVVADAAEREH